MRELVYASGALVYALILGPPLVFLVLALVLGLGEGLGDALDRRRRWRALERELTAGRSPLQRWAEEVPRGLWEGRLALTRPARLGPGRWSLGALGDAPLALERADEAPGFRLRVGDAEPALRDFAWDPVARGLVELALRAPLRAAGEDSAALCALVASLDGLLWVPLDLPCPPTDAVALYQAAAPFLPARGLLPELSTVGAQAACEAWAEGLREADWDLGELELSHLPEGRWRAANKLDDAHLPGPEDLDDPHWADHDEGRPVLLLSDGGRTLELQMDPFEGPEVLGLYESLEAFLARGVLLRLADAMEARLGRGGWSTPGA